MECDYYIVRCLNVHFTNEQCVIQLSRDKGYLKNNIEPNPPVTVYPDMMEISVEELFDYVEEDLIRLHKSWHDITKIILFEKHEKC